ncbi:TPA: hypothetical protein QIF01_003346 [Serratia marcescens]|nr:hypothetical protein [Serratia marcescens]
MDKQQEESRRQFEEHYSNKNPHSKKALEKWGDTPPNSEDYKSLKTQEAWEIWQASRASIVVELPRPSCVYADHSYPAYSQKQVEDLLNSIGLSIKGE